MSLVGTVGTQATIHSPRKARRPPHLKFGSGGKAPMQNGMRKWARMWTMHHSPFLSLWETVISFQGYTKDLRIYTNWAGYRAFRVSLACRRKGQPRSLTHFMPIQR